MRKTKYVINPTEHEEQSAFFDWLFHRRADVYELAYAIPNGSNKSVAAAQKFKREGLKSGVPDVCIAMPRGRYSGAYIEFKRRHTGYVSADQRAWLDRLSNRGYCCIVAKGCADAVEFIEAYLKLEERKS